MLFDPFSLRGRDVPESHRGLADVPVLEPGRLRGRLAPGSPRQPGRGRRGAGHRRSDGRGSARPHQPAGPGHLEGRARRAAGPHRPLRARAGGGRRCAAGARGPESVGGASVGRRQARGSAGRVGRPSSRPARSRSMPATRRPSRWGRPTWPPSSRRSALRPGARCRPASSVLEVHAAHGYLIHEFLSPVTNRRDDDWGGTFDNRIRLLLEVVRAIRRVVPDGLPLLVRLSTTDWLERDAAGWTVEDSIALARRLKGEGVDLIDCSSGGHRARDPHRRRPRLSGPERGAHPRRGGDSDRRDRAHHVGRAGRADAARRAGRPGVPGPGALAGSVLAAARRPRAARHRRGARSVPARLALTAARNQGTGRHARPQAREKGPESHPHRNAQRSGAPRRGAPAFEGDQLVGVAGPLVDGQRRRRPAPGSGGWAVRRRGPRVRPAASRRRVRCRPSRRSRRSRPGPRSPGSACRWSRRRRPARGGGPTAPSRRAGAARRSSRRFRRWPSAARWSRRRRTCSARPARRACRRRPRPAGRSRRGRAAPTAMATARCWAGFGGASPAQREAATRTATSS